jgi:hypothetical protein
MGLGDEIMVTGQAHAMGARDSRPVAVRGRNGARWHALWNGNPRIARPAEVASGRDVQWLVNGPGRRPYVDYARTSKRRWAYTDWACVAGEIYLSDAEIDWARRQGDGRFAVIEPHIKPGASPNKRWGLERSQAVVDRMGGCQFVQFAGSAGPPLHGVRVVQAPSFRHACAVLARARGYLGPEGGLHHAAAALGVPAVVIFGGMTSPANTGYQGHVNLFDDGPESPCGRRVRCPHCARAMAAITPEQVAYHLEHMLNG